MTRVERRVARRWTGDLAVPMDRIPSPHNALSRWCSGISQIDAALPEAGMSTIGVHEVSSAAYGDAVAASSYALTLLNRLARLSQAASGARPCAPILWCQTACSRHEFGAIHGRGLEAFGFAAKQFLFAEASHNRDVLWALEEGARSADLLAVVGEVDAVSFTETRRLALAAAAGRTPVLLLRPHHDHTASATETRWRIAAEPGADNPFLSNAPGHPRWQIKLERCRGGRPGAWAVEWNYETHRFSLVERFFSRLSPVADAPGQPTQVHTLQRRFASA